MILNFKKSFARDLKKRKTDKPLLDRVRQIIKEVEEAQGNHYRIRMGDYRLGLVIEEDTVCFVRFLHRGEVYTYFP